MGNQVLNQAVVRKCCERIGEVSADCSDCAGLGPAGRQRRVDQLIAEVDEARQENQRLNKQSHKLRAALASAQQQQQAPSHAGVVYEQRLGLGALQANSGAPIEQELIQLRRHHSELKRENALLKQGDSGFLFAARRDEKRVNLQQYSQLRRQLEELQRAHDAAAAQTERLRRQSATISPVHSPTVLSPSGGFGVGGSGRGGLGLGSGPGSYANSGRATPVNGDFHSPFNGLDGSFARTGDSSFNTGREGATAEPAEADLRRRMQAVHAENDRLRRQVRMLASKNA